MARLLALDWDNQEYHLVSASIGRKRVQLERAIAWREEAAFNADDAEAFGQRLRERMKEAGIAAAPIIVGLGRERMVVKEIRYPQVSAADEAVIVRNQINKDLTDSPEDVYLDYVPLADPDRNGMRRALSLVVRRDVIRGIQKVCAVAGLKLLGITGRPFGIASCLKNLAGKHPQVPAPPAADAVTAVLTVAETWAEFSAVRGDQLLFARSVGVGDTLFGEVRRNLAAYAGQPQLTFPRDAIQAFYVCGNGENAVLREKMQETLGIPVHGLDPFVLEERVDVHAANRAGFTGAVGLLHIWAESNALPANFVKPRESKPVASPTKRRFVIYGALAAALLLALFVGAQMVLARDRDSLARHRKEKANLEKQFKELQPEAKYLEALTEWNNGAIPWLDELYDLAARSPYEVGFRITQVSVNPLPPSKAGKEKHHAIMKVHGVAPADRGSQMVQRFAEKINKDPHCEASIDHIKTVGEAGKAKLEFVINVKIARQPMGQYTAQIDGAGAVPGPGAEEDKTPPKKGKDFGKKQKGGGQ